MLITGLLIFGIVGGIGAELLYSEPLGGFFATLFDNASVTDLWGSVLKTTMFGAIIAIVCCYKGMTASGGAEGVGRAVNEAVVVSFMGFFAFNYVFTQTLLAAPRAPGDQVEPNPAPLCSGAPVSFYVTTPIYYVNGEPHLGHAYSTIAADILARHHRQRGEDVFFLTGTDEHGEPVAQQAEAEGVTPRELGDRLAPRFRELAARVNASNDFFIRTTDEGHIERVQEIVQRVYDNGHVYEGMYEGWYCPRCADFKTESELGPDNTCPIHKIPLTRESQKNWFFALSKFQGDLEKLYEERPGFVIPEFRKNEALAFIKQGLQDVSLSRPTLKWGVPVPWDTDQVIYVWFDALLNYYTALGYGADEDVTEKFWPPFHILAKDILKFHAVYWPAFLMAAEIEVPRRMFIHGFLLMEGHKMSKSLGNVLDPDDVIDKFGADPLRFYCFREVSFGQDGQISPAGFESRYEAELADQYGNLANRVLSMIGRYRDGTIPDAEAEVQLASDFAGAPDRVRALLDGAELTQALEEIWKLIRRLNQYVEETRPWELAKDDTGAERLDAVLYGLAEGLRVTTLLLHAYMPETTGRLLEAIGERGRALVEFASRDGGQSLGELAPLFPKLAPERA